MNVTFIAQSVVGTVTAASGVILIVKPQWFGIYPDVDLYAVDDSSTVNSSVSAPSVSGTGAGVSSTSPGTGTSTKKTPDENEKNLKCKVIDTKIEYYDCAVFTITESNNYINANSKEKKLTNVTSSTSKTTTYYRIIVSEKLVNQLNNESNAKMSIHNKNAEGDAIDNGTSEKLNIKSLFSHYNSVITLPSGQKQTYFVGQADEHTYEEKDTAQATSVPPSIPKMITKTVTSITAAGKNKYQCSFWKSDFKNCEINYLQDGTTANTSMDNLTFKENASDVAKITSGEYYLIKNHEWYSNFYLTSVSDTSQEVTNDKIIKFKDVTAAAIVTDNGKNILFHFKNTK